MKNRFQSYLAFLPRAYRLVMFLLLPLLTLTIPVLLQKGQFLTISYLVAMLLANAEIIMDFWAFGGIAMKNGLQLEYIKTSRRGMSMVQNALCIGLFRIFMDAAAVSTVCGLIFGSINGFSFLSDGKLWSYLCILLAEYICVALAQLICRFFDGLWIYLLSSYVVSGLLLGACFLGKYHYAVTFPFLILAAVLVSVTGVKIIMWRVRESYYDKAA